MLHERAERRSHLVEVRRVARSLCAGRGPCYSYLHGYRAQPGARLTCVPRKPSIASSTRGGGLACKRLSEREHAYRGRVCGMVIFSLDSGKKMYGILNTYKLAQATHSWSTIALMVSSSCMLADMFALEDIWAFSYLEHASSDVV